MEVILAVLRPRQNIGGHDHKSRNGLHEYKPRLYDILLLDSTRDNESRPTKYLPAFPLTNNEEEPRDEVLTNLYQLTGGEKHKGIKGTHFIYYTHHFECSYTVIGVFIVCLSVLLSSLPLYRGVLISYLLVLLHHRVKFNETFGESQLH